MICCFIQACGWGFDVYAGRNLIFQITASLKKFETRQNGRHWIVMKQAMDVPQVVTERNKLLVSLKKSSGGIAKSKRLGCFSSTMY